jgi:hypothetical protein
LENVSKSQPAKSRMQKLEVTAEQFAEHRRRFPIRNSFAAGVLTDELEINLWNQFLNSDDPSIAQEASKLARAYGLRATKKDSGG